MRNVELKARGPEPAWSLERALSLGAEDRGEIRQVTKRRRLLLWDGVRIHFDEMEGLGTTSSSRQSRVRSRS